MKTIEQIVVGTDFSPNSVSALREALRLANHGPTSRVVCMHTVDNRLMEDLRSDLVDEDAIRINALERLQTFVRELGSDVDVDCRVAIGHPFEQLLATVREIEAQLLILGTRGTKHKKSGDTGTFATQCVRKMPVEVLLVRQHQTQPFRRVVACVDFSETSERAVHRAADVAVSEGAELDLIHVWEPPLIDPGGDYGGFGAALPVIDAREMTPILEKRMSEFTEKALEGSPLAESANQIVEQGFDVAHSIAEHVTETDADLVVLGTRGRTGLRSLLMGTTAEKLIRRAPCSIWALKPENFKFS